MYLVACGLVTPVGLSFPAATAALRAGVAAFNELPYHDGLGKPAIGAEIPEIAEGWRGTERLARFLIPAIRECLDEGKIPDAASVPIVINLAERDAPGRSVELDDRLSTMLAEGLGGRLHPSSVLLREGRVGAAQALAIARGILARGGKQCLIAGVDSLINAQALAYFADRDRLKTEVNPDGLIPGEAAGAVLLDAAPSTRGGPVVEIAGIGFGQEQVRPESDDTVLGVGLASAIKAALEDAGIDIADAACRLSDLTGEKYFFLEANYALGRLLRRRKVEFPLWHPMDSIGDSGAAAGFCLLAVAMAAIAKGYAPGTVLLCQMSAESGRRAAVIVRGIG
jgi:3-oxoacyl-[acyl-carrier-protein] synthase-1